MYLRPDIENPEEHSQWNDAKTAALEADTRSHSSADDDSREKKTRAHTDVAAASDPTVDEQHVGKRGTLEV